MIRHSLGFSDPDPVLDKDKKLATAEWSATATNP